MNLIFVFLDEVLVCGKLLPLCLLGLGVHCPLQIRKFAKVLRIDPFLELLSILILPTSQLLTCTRWQRLFRHLCIWCKPEASHFEILGKDV